MLAFSFHWFDNYGLFAEAASIKIICKWEVQVYHVMKTIYSENRRHHACYLLETEDNWPWSGFNKLVFHLLFSCKLKDEFVCVCVCVFVFDLSAAKNRILMVSNFARSFIAFIKFKLKVKRKPTLKCRHVFDSRLFCLRVCISTTHSAP